MWATRPAAGTFLTFEQMNTDPCNMFGASNWSFNRSDPTNPLVTSQGGEIIPEGENSRGVEQGQLQISWYFVDNTSSNFGGTHELIITNFP